MQATPPPLASTPASSSSTTSWTKIIGIIAIIFGTGGLLQGLFAPFSLMMVKPQMQAFVEQGADQAKVDDYLSQLAQVSYAGAVAYGVLGIMLLTGVILILRHHKAGSPLLQIWAVLKILIGGGLIYKNSSLTGMQMNLMLSSETLGGAQEAQMVGSIASYAVWIGLAFGFIWLCVLPVFLLIWLNRGRIKGEISTW